MGQIQRQMIVIHLCTTSTSPIDLVPASTSSASSSPLTCSINQSCWSGSGCWMSRVSLRGFVEGESSRKKTSSGAHKIRELLQLPYSYSSFPAFTVRRGLLLNSNFNHRHEAPPPSCLHRCGARSAHRSPSNRHYRRRHSPVRLDSMFPICNLSFSPPPIFPC
jgi:hypothetical protein